jgi:O6-methylguanine-DNA--protein-cysteine methyltransferase
MANWPPRSAIRARRAVGQALGNPFPIVVPCHRVSPPPASGRIFCVNGRATKRQLLVIEGAIPAQGQLFPNGGQ